jgi:hypothetical protein
VKRSWLLVPAVLLVLAGCISYTPPTPSPFASPQADAQAKQFSPAQGKGNLYISRPGEFAIFGKPAPYGTTLDGKEAGGIMPEMYFCFALDPGTHTLGVSCQDSMDTVTVRVEPGKNYYYQINSSNVDNRTKLSLGWVIIDAMGKLMVNNTKRGQAAME